MAQQVARFGGEAHHQRRATRLPRRDARENIGIFDKGQRQRSASLLFLDLVGRRLDAPIGDRRGADEYVGRQRRLDRREHFASRFDMTRFDAGRVGNGHRAADQRHARARQPGGGGDGVSLLAGGAIGDEANGVDRLMRRPRGHDDMAPREDEMAPREQAGVSSRRGERGANRLHDLGRLAHAPRAIFAAGHLAVFRPDEQCAVRAQPRDVAPRRRMQPHAHIHRRGEQDPLIGGQQKRRRQIVGQPMRRAREQIGGRRRDDDEVGLPRKLNMPHFAFARRVEEIGVNRRSRNRRK